MRKTLFALGMFVPMAMWGQAFDVKPGLWENTVNTEIAGMPAMPAMPEIPKETLDKMPPAQRAQIENMMKGRGGGTPRSTTVKSCMTKEQLTKPVFNNPDKSCSTKIVSATPAVQKLHMDCSPSGIKMSGDVTIERVDAEHFKGTSDMKASGPDGRAMDIKMVMTGKWLAGDCGDVKPYDGKQ